jgi:hypothetical protein
MEAEIWPTASQIAPDQSILDSLTLPMVPAANSAGQEIKNDQSTLSGALYKVCLNPACYRSYGLLIHKKLCSYSLGC